MTLPEAQHFQSWLFRIFFSKCQWTHMVKESPLFVSSLCLHPGLHSGGSHPVSVHSFGSEAVLGVMSRTFSSCLRNNVVVFAGRNMNKWWQGDGWKQTIFTVVLFGVLPHSAQCNLFKTFMVGNISSLPSNFSCLLNNLWQMMPVWVNNHLFWCVVGSSGSSSFL